MSESLVVDPSRLKKLLRRMIDIYSPSGKEEEILDFVHGYLKRRDIPVRKQIVDEGRYNLLVLPSEPVQLLFVGHLDTIPAHELDESGFREDGDTIYGLGAADMKGGCAAMIEVLVALREKGCHRTPVGLALVVGEEEEGDGADVLAGELELPWVLIGEPTDLRPCLSNYGYIEVRLITKGKRRHASLAEPGKNPIMEMMVLVTGVIQQLEQRDSGIIYNIRDLYSTGGGYIVPDLCETFLDVHAPPSAPLGEIVARIEEAVETSRNKEFQLDSHVRFETIDSGFEIPERGRVVELLRSIYRNHGRTWALEPFKSHSDANRLWHSGAKPLILGPGKLDQAHIPGEKISFTDVVTAATLYLDLAIGLGNIPATFSVK